VSRSYSLPHTNLLLPPAIIDVIDKAISGLIRLIFKRINKKNLQKLHKKPRQAYYVIILTIIGLNWIRVCISSNMSFVVHCHKYLST